MSVRMLSLEGDLSTEELEARYKSSHDVHERQKWQMLWLVSRRKTTREIADFLGVHPQTVRECVCHYNEQGEDSIADKRKLARGGPPPVLDEAGLQALNEALKAPHPDGGLWNGPKVSAWIGAWVGRTVSDYTGWKYLHKLGWSVQSPRPQSSKADPAAQEAFKKSAPANGDAGSDPAPRSGRRGRVAYWTLRKRHKHP